MARGQGLAPGTFDTSRRQRAPGQRLTDPATLTPTRVSDEVSDNRDAHLVTVPTGSAPQSLEQSAHLQVNGRSQLVRDEEVEGTQLFVLELVDELLELGDFPP